MKIKEPLVLGFRKAPRTYNSHERTGKHLSLGFFLGGVSFRWWCCKYQNRFSDFPGNNSYEIKEPP
jgi:hypothetical protein